MIRSHESAGVRVLTATLSDGRVYRTIVPPGAWRRFIATPEEWICGVAGVQVAKGMYG